MMIVFGAACFNFGIHLNKTGDIDAKQYAAYLEKALYESDHVQRNSIIIEYDDTFDYGLEKTDTFESLGDGHGFPLPMYFSLQFDLIIPRQVQEALTKQNKIILKVLKQVRVIIKDTFFGPVTLIEVESNDVDEGSSAVVLVREYLANHFRDKNLYFECIGPSPFHCDFSISALSDNDDEHLLNLDKNGFLCTTNPQKGYDHIAFLYSRERYETVQMALEELFQHLDDELGIFYLMIKFRAQRIESWLKINILYKELIAKAINTNLVSRMKRLFNFDGNTTHQLLHELTMFEIMVMEQSSELQSGYESVYQKGIPVYLQKLIDKKFELDLNNYPTKEIIYYLEFHEKRYMQIWQTSLLASSALMGAIIGSLVTALLTSYGSKL
jgi:hypothetical protein